VKKIKSAKEIAMEKTQNIQGNREEARTLEQEQYVKAASILGKSLIQGKTDPGQVQEAIQRYPEACREAAIDALIKTVQAEMDLENTPQVLETIMALKPDEETRTACEGVRKLYEQYRQQRDQALQGLEKNASQFMEKKLAREGITGSAIAGFNIKSQEQSQEVVAGITAGYRNILAQTFQTT